MSSQVKAGTRECLWAPVQGPHHSTPPTACTSPQLPTLGIRTCAAGDPEPGLAHRLPSCWGVGSQQL